MLKHELTFVLLLSSMVELLYLLACPVLIVPEIFTSCRELVQSGLRLDSLRDLLSVKFKVLVGEEHFNYLILSF